jgi:tape measure domain-containing protein
VPYKIQLIIDADAKAGPKIKKLVDGIMQDFDHMDKGSKKLDKSTSQLGLTLKKVGGILGVYFGVRTLKNLADSIFDAGIQVSRFEAGLKGALGSVEAAAESVNWLTEVSDELGLTLESQVGAFQKLAAAARGTSLEGEKTKNIFLAVSEAATAMQLSGEQTEGALFAIGQMISKGTVAAEELRGQLGERLPGAFQIAARAMGVTTQELGKMLEQGEVVAEDFLPRFAKALHDELGEAAKDAAGTVERNINRLSNVWFQFRSDIAGQVMPVLNESLEDLIGTIRELEETGTLKAWAEAIGGALGWVIDTTTRTTKALADMFGTSLEARLWKTRNEIQLIEEQLSEAGKGGIKEAAAAMFGLGDDTEYLKSKLLGLQIAEQQLMDQMEDHEEGAKDLGETERFQIDETVKHTQMSLKEREKAHKAFLKAADKTNAEWVSRNKIWEDEAHLQHVERLQADLREERGVHEITEAEWQAMMQKRIDEADKSKSLMQSVWDSVKTNYVDSVEDMTRVFVEAEDTKRAIADFTGRFIVGRTSALASEMYNRAIDKIIKLIGAYLGEGAAGAGAQGAALGGVPGALAEIGLYLSAGVGAMLASRTIAQKFMATGGWLDKHPHGGWIREGTGAKDDVLLGFTPGTRHWAMGGEFVMNKKASAKFGPLLEAMNRNYDEGGYITWKGRKIDWTNTADLLALAAGWSFMHGFTKGGGPITALAEMAGFFSRAVPAMFAVKMAEDRFMTEGGWTDKEYFFGGLLSPFEKLFDKFYKAIPKPLRRLLPKAFDPEELKDALLDVIRAPMQETAKDLVTPGKYYTEPISNIVRTLGHSAKSIWKLAGLALPSFDEGGVMPYTGPAHLKRGEVVLTPEQAARPAVINNYYYDTLLRIDGSLIMPDRRQFYELIETIREKMLEASRRGTPVVHQRGIDTRR